MYIPRSEYPCADQNQPAIETYYRAVQIGSEVAIRETHGGILRYFLSTVDKINRGRIYPKGHQSFFAKSGSMCSAPHGQCNLVVPTDAVKAFVAANPPNYGLCYSRYVVDSGPANLEEARAKLAAAEGRLAQLERAWDNYSGNNPNKYRSSIKMAQLEVSVLAGWVKKFEDQQSKTLNDS